MATCHGRWRLLTSTTDTFGSNTLPLCYRRLTSADITSLDFGNFISFVFSYPLDMECWLTHCSGLFPLSSSLPLRWLSLSISCYLQSCNIHLLMFPGLSSLEPRRYLNCSKAKTVPLSVTLYHLLHLSFVHPQLPQYLSSCAWPRKPSEITNL